MTLPYIEIPPLDLASGKLDPFPVLIVTGILVGYWTMLRRAPRE